MATFLPVRRGDPLVRLKLRRRYLPLVLLGAGLLVGGGAVATLGSLYSSTPSSQIALQKGLVGWWKLDGNAKDSSPYRNNGTVNGASLTIDRKGKSNSAYSFTRANSNYISVADSTALNFGTGDLAISVWFKVSSITTASQQIVCKRDSTGDYEVQVNANDGHVYAYLGSTAAISSAAVTPGVWYHVVASRASGVTTLYLNSAVSGSANSASTASSVGTPLNIGRDVHSTAEYFDGSISDVRIWKRALSQTEVSALYNEYNPGIKADSGESGLIGWWKFLGNTKDSSPFRNNVTVNNATLISDREGLANAAYSFNGASQQWMQLPSAAFPTYPASGNTSNYSQSFSVWFQTSSNGPILGQDQSTALPPSNTPGSFVPALFVDTSGKLNASFYWHNANGNKIISSASVNNGAWHHVVDTYSGGTETLYLDGAQVGTQTFNEFSYAPGTYNYTLGAAYGVSGWSSLWNTPSWKYFTGSISDVRVYNRALSSAEVTNLYNSYNSQISVDSYSSKVNLSAGLVGYWNFNGNVNDSTPYRNNGTNNGASLTTDRNSRGNSAYSFNGTTNNINIPGYARLSPGANSFSVSIWLNTTTRADIVNTSDNNQGAFSHGYGLTLSSSSACGATGMVDFEMANGTTRDSILCSTRTLNDGQWHMLTVVVDRTSGNKYVYIDGSLNNSATITISGSVTNSRMAIGQAVWWGNWGGSLDDLRIYNRALSAAEVTSLYSDYR